MKQSLRILLLTLSLPLASRAADGSWSNDADGAWSDLNNWAGGVIATGTDARAYFTNAIAAPRTVSNDISNNTIGHLVFDSLAGTGWTLDGRPLALAVSVGAPTATVVSGEALVTLRTTGSQGLTKDGTGKLRLSGNNQFTGTMTVAAGELSLSGGVVNASVALAAGATLSAYPGQGLVGEYYYVAPPNVNNIHPLFTTRTLLQAYLSGFSPNALFNGPASGSILDFGSAGLGTNWPPGTPAASVQARWRGQFYAPLDGTYFFATGSDDGSMLWIDGTNVVANNYYQGSTRRTGTIDLTTGLHEFILGYYQGGGDYNLYVEMALPGGGATNRLDLFFLQTPPAIGSLSGPVSSAIGLAGASLTVAQSTDGTFAGTLGGTYPLRKIGAATLTLPSDNNSFTGGLLIEAGRIAITQSVSLGATTAPIVLDGGILRIGGTAVTTLDAYNLNWNSFHGTLEIADSANVFTVASAIDGVGIFGKAGPGLLRLTGTSPHVGTLLVSSGTVDVAAGASIASAFAQVNAGGTLSLNSSTALSTNATVSLHAIGALYGKLYFTNGVNQTVAALAYGGLLQRPGTYGATGSGAANINDNFFAGVGLLTVTGSGTSQDADGSWRFDGNGDWSATNNWQSGVIAYGTNSTALFTNTLTAGRTVNNNYALLDIGNLYFRSNSNYTWTVTNGAMNLVTTSGVPPAITVAVNTAIVGSVLQGSQGFSKSGAGQLALAGQGTYAGTTTVNQGSLLLTGNATLYNAGAGAGAVVVKNGATLTFNRSDVFGNHVVTSQVPVVIEAGGLVQNNANVFNTLHNLALGGGELRANGGNSTNFQAFQLKGTVTVSGVTASLISETKLVNVNNQIQLGNNTANGTTEINVADVTGNAAADLVVSASFADGHLATGANPATPSGFVKTGPGTMKLTGNNINTGPSSVNAGDVVVSGGVVNGPVSVSAGTMVSAEYGPGIVGEYYFTGPNTNPVQGNFNTMQHFANHLAGLPRLWSVYNGPNNSTNFFFPQAGGWPIAAPNSQWYEGRWAGKYVAPVSGTYAFTTTSDDGSMIWINGTNVVNNNNFQGETTRTGLVSLTAGLHDIVIAYYQGTGGYSVNASNTIPGVYTGLLQLAQIQTPPAIGSLSGVAGGVVNVSNAPLTIAQITDSSFGGAFAGTNAVRKIGHGTLTLTADNASFPGLYELAGGRTAVSQDNFLPAQLTFNGGLLSVTGTGMTSLGAHSVNWPTFIGGVDVADAANTFSVTADIGAAGTLASFWKYGPGLLVLNGNANVLNLGLNVVTGQMTMTANSTLANGGIYVARGSLFVHNAYLANLSNTADYVANVAGDSGVLTLGGTGLYFKTQNALYVANQNGSRGDAVLQDSSTLYFPGPSIYLANNTGAKATFTVRDNATLRTTGGNLYIGNMTSSAAFYQKGGTLALASDMNFPRNNGGYGFLHRTGGSATNTGYTQNGGGVGLFHQEGGSYAQLGNFLQLGNNVGGTGTGVLWITGGSITSTPAIRIAQSTSCVGEFNIAGGQVYAPNLLLNNAAGNRAIVNLNGGLVQVNSIFKQTASGTNIVNLNGGVLQARSSGNLLGAGAQVPDNIYVRPGGAILDSGISAAYIVPNLLAPPGDGVASIALTNAGAGYIGAPYVMISGGGGTGATAVAEIDLTAGTVTNIRITSPGVNYASAPAVALVGGGFTAPAGLGLVTTAPNASGGLTIQGSGSVTLLGTNTYTGATILSNGILLVNSTNAIGGSLILATNTAGIGPTYALDQAFIDWVTTKVAGAGSGGVIALGTNSANNLDLTSLTNWSLGAAAGNQIFSGGLTLPSTNVYLGGGGGNLLFQPNLVTGTNYFIGPPGGSPIGVVTMTGTNDTYASGIIVQGGNLRASRINSFGTNSTVTVQSGGSLDVFGQNLGTVRVYAEGKGASGVNGAIINTGTNAMPGLYYVTLTADATFGGPARWDIRSGAPGPKLDLAGYTMTKTNGNEVCMVNAQVTDGNMDIGQGLFRFENAASATTGVGQITVGPAGRLDFWNFSGVVTRPVTVNGGVVSVGAGTAVVGSPFTLVGPTNTFMPANNTTFLPTNLISGGGTFLKMGLGTVKLPQAGAHTGPTLVSLGRLELAVNDPINGALSTSSGVLVNNGGILLLDYDYGLSGQNPLQLTVGNGGFLSTSNGVGYHLDKAFTLAGGIITGGVPHATDGNWVLQTNVPVTALSSIVAPRTQLGVAGGVTFGVAAPGGLTVSGTLEDPNGGTGALIKDGSGTMTITSTNTYQGATIVAGGTLKLAAYAPAGGASIWLDAADEATITRDGSGFVSQWSDKSGHGRHATQSTNGLKPLFVTNALLNKTVVNFSGSPQIMNANLSFLANNGYSIFAVEGRTNTNAQSYFLGTQLASNNNGLHMGYRTDTQFTIAQYANDLNYTMPGYSGQQFRLWDGIFDFVNQYLYLDMTNVASRGNGTPFNPTLGPGVIGCGLPGAYYYQGDLAEILIYNRSVSTVERQQIEGYLRAKWFGVTPPALADLLPVGTALQIASGATFDLGGVSQSVGSLADYAGGGGTVLSSVPGLGVVFTTGGDGSNTVFSGAIADGAGTVAFSKDGAGSLVLHGLSTFNGETALSNGALIVNGALAGTNLCSITAGTLGGTGTIGGMVVQTGGTVAPGASPGRLTMLRDYYQGGDLAIEIAGTNAANGYDQLVVGGTATLIATLTVTTNGYAPVPGDSFTILTASNGIVNTFVSATLPELTAGSGWVIDYQANAVVLSVTGAPSVAGYDLYAGQIPNTADRGYQNDPDGDGYANLLEYVTGGNPTNADVVARMSAARTNGLLALKFSRNIAATDATLYVEGSYAATNDATWSGIATNLAGSWGGAGNVSEAGGPNPVDVTVADTVSPATNRFLRLRVTRP